MRVTAKMLLDAGWVQQKVGYLWWVDPRTGRSHGAARAVEIYKQQAAREASLDQLSAEAQRLGMYDLEGNKA